MRKHPYNRPLPCLSHIFNYSHQFRFTWRMGLPRDAGFLLTPFAFVCIFGLIVKGTFFGS